MPRRRRRSRVGGLSFAGVVILIFSLLLLSQKKWPALAIFWIFLLVLWLAFFKQTQCDVEKDNGEGCGNPAHVGLGFGREVRILGTWDIRGMLGRDILAFFTSCIAPQRR